MTSELGICIVGCGYMGQIHAERWAKIPGVRIAAVADIDHQRADAMANRYRLEVYYTDYLDAISQPDVHVVSVCVPTSLHADVTIASAQLRKHVLCETPMALTLEDADRMITSTKDNDVKLGIGFMRRHSPVVQDLK